MMKRILALVCVMLCVCSLCACTKNDPTSAKPDSKEALYKVTVVNGAGVPYTEKIVVKLMQGSTQVAMLAVNDQGTVEKTLTKGDYTVEIMSTDNSQKFYYDTASAKLSAEVTELQLVLAKEAGDACETIFAGGAENPAVYVTTGSTHAAVAAGARTYFLFVPTEPGSYVLSVLDGKAELGVYGASIHYIADNSLMEVVDGKIEISVQPSMISSEQTGTTVYVLGVDAPEGTTDAIINIIRTGDPEWSFSEEPWSTYYAKNEIKDFTLTDGVTLKDFDLTASSDAYALIYNSVDGYYHLNAEDGPLVYAQLGKEVYGISLMEMVGEIVYKDGVLMQTGSAPFRYSYDNGKDDFFKEDYTNVMREYVTARDKNSGVYPLNQDLYYILTMGIKTTGWCDSDNMNYRFTELANVNSEISWMFLLMHEDGEIPSAPSTDPADPTKPTEPDDSPVGTEPAEPVHCHSYKKTVTAPDCTKDGYTTYTCSCGESYASDKVNAIGHSFGNWVTVKESTVSEKGKAERKCSTCSFKEERELDKLIANHTHSYTAVVTKTATCTATGVKTYTCSCGSTYTESIAALGHDYKSSEVDSTCTEKGYTLYTCSRCNDSYKGNADKAAKGHSFEMNGLCIRCGIMDSDVAIDDNADNHEEIGGKLQFEAFIAAGHMMHFDVYRVGGTTLTIENPNAFVIYEGTTYHAENGVVTVPKLVTEDPSIPVALVIGNHGAEDAVFTVKMSYPEGAQMNPYVLTSFGKLTTEVEEGNDQGIYYQYIATTKGKLTITIDAVSNGATAGVTLYNLDTYQQRVTEESNTVSVDVAAGQTVQIIIAVLPDSSFTYPAATIHTTATFVAD